MHWSNRYVGIPFVDGGRTMRGCDCWGIVCAVYKRECGIELPGYGDISASELNAIAFEIAKESAKEPWHLLNAGQQRDFDVAVMHRRREAFHVGIAVDSDKVLHIDAKTDSVLVPTDHLTVKFKNILFFRHKDLA